MPPHSATTKNDSFRLLHDDHSTNGNGSTTKTSHKRRHPTVCFEDSVEEVEVETLLGLSPQKTREFFYSKYDFVLIQRDTNKILRKVEQGAFKEERGDHSAVGLFTQEELAVKGRRRRQARNVVFREQNLQRRNKHHDASRIAELYTETTLECREEAVGEGCRAASEAADNHKKPKRKNIFSLLPSIGTTSRTGPTKRNSFTSHSPVRNNDFSGKLKRSLSHSPKRGSSPVLFSASALKRNQIAPLE